MKNAVIWTALIVAMLGIWLALSIISNNADRVSYIPPADNQEETDNLKKEISKGIYEVCSDISDCDIEYGIARIKEAGLDSVIVTVIDEDDGNSLAYYDSDILDRAEYIANGYIEEIIRVAHQNDISVYLSINMPHNYLLNRHPDWITVWSDGRAGDYYHDDYFHRTVPPPRWIEEDEAKNLLKNLIAEVSALGPDGIDINDNFSFTDEYIESTDTTLFASFDDFTLEQFGGNPSMDNPDWLRWRADQVTALIAYLDSVTELPLRPHLLTHGNPYAYYGLDYEKLGDILDVMYLMIMPDQPRSKYLDLAGQTEGGEYLSVSTYFIDDLENPYPLKTVMSWIQEMGADQINFYNFASIERHGLWNEISR